MRSHGRPDSRHALGILARTALFSWLVAIVTLAIFIAVVVPAQRAAYLDNLASKAHGVAASLQDIAAGAAISEDYSAIVDHCTRILAEDASIDYLVLTRKDGFSLIHEREGWRSEQLQGLWLPDERVAGGFLRHDPETKGEFYHYSRPFDYSGIQWGWIHVGLSLRGYNESVQALYHRTSLAGVISLLLGLFISVFYARQLTRPIMRLREAVLRLAGGDLSVRASVSSKDEVGELGASFNRMTESLLQRDTMLQSIRFAAQQFLSAEDWRSAIPEVLTQLGQALAASRVFVFENLHPDDVDPHLNLAAEWNLDPVQASPIRSNPQPVSYGSLNLDRHLEDLRNGRAIVVERSKLPPDRRAVLDRVGFKSGVLIPIHVGGRWWGALGAHESRFERPWSEAEVASLRAAAHTLSAAVERDEARRALVIAKDAAEAASEAKSQFLANMSHEIRTPITGVMGMLHLLQRTELNQKQNRYVGNAVAAAGTLLTVIGDVLDFSKIEARRLELEESAFAVPEMLETAVRVFAEKAESKGVELAYRLDPAVPRILRGDEDRLRQILVNLIGNALKFTERGEVIISCTLGEEAEDSVLLRFSVRDTGSGIAPEQQGLVFEAFSQADNSMSRVHGGTGLGLAICRQLCQLMDGEIGVESTLDVGSDFWFTARLGRAEAGAVGAEAGWSSLRGLRVLVVDDCETTLNIVSEYVESWKGRAETAPDAARGLDTLRRAAGEGQPFPVAVLDWKMPGVDGVTMARLIKEDPALRATGLVLLSSFAQSHECLDGGQNLFAASVPKPARMSELYDAIVTAANGQLKLHPRARTAAAAAQASVQVSGAGGVILLVEDNEINREVASEMITAMGFQCLQAVNGREAVAKAQAGGIDLVLMDCQMPVMDGYEATGIIRQWERMEGGSIGRLRIPIIALTAHAMKGDRDECLQSGMDDFLTKPLDPDELGQTLMKWMMIRHGQIEADRRFTLAPPEVPLVIPDEVRLEASAASADDGPIDYPSLIHRCMGKQALAERLVAKFLELVGPYADEVYAAVERQDAAALKAAAHRLKGSSANVSALAVSQVAAELEDLGQSGELETAPERAAALRREVDRLGRSAEQMNRRAA